MLAHEFGHHIQLLTGVAQKVRRAQQSAHPRAHAHRRGDDVEILEQQFSVRLLEGVAERYCHQLQADRLSVAQLLSLQQALQCGGEVHQKFRLMHMVTGRRVPTGGVVPKRQKLPA
ncbi:MAG: hypothetical protein HC937_02210 [Aquincola sp.]|nr:hypothetical protein [Aquincola sp.]